MKKLVFILLLSCFALFLPVKTFAQTLAPVAQKPLTQYPLNTNSDVPQNFHTYTQNTFIEILATAMCFTVGIDPISADGKCLGIDPSTHKVGYVNNNSGGLMAITGGMIGSTFNIPVSSFQYDRYLASKFGITKTSYAAFGKGVGFVGLTPILPIWVAFRNVTYFLFVFVFILLGLGIMFRVNIDARTIMTIQNQIPKIVIGLILITFSYAIAGFLIDMMYVAMYLVVYFFNSNHLITVTAIDKNPFEALGGFGGINGIAEPAAKSIGGTLGSIFDGNLGGGLGSFITKVLGAVMAGSAGAGIGKMLGGIAGLGLGIAAVVATPFTGGLSAALIPAAIAIGTGVAAGSTVGSLIGGAAGAGVGFAAANSIISLVAFLIAYLIIVVALLQSLFRVWFMLIKAYLFIILDVILAPFWIVGGIIPGFSGGVGPWIRSLLANLSAFPLVLILFMIGKTIQEQAINTPQTFVPPFIGNIGKNPVEAMSSLIGLGLILIMPEAINITKAAFKAPEHKLASTIGRSLGIGQAVIGKPFGAVRGEFFGKDALGAPKEGSRWAANRFGKIGRVLTGGGIADRSGDPKTPWVKFPHPLGKKMDSGGREKNWLGRLTPEGQELQNARKTTKETLGKGEFDEAKHVKYTVHGEEHIKNRVDGADSNGGTGRTAGGGNPTQPQNPSPQSDPNAGAHEQSPEGAEESTENTNAAPAEDTTQDVSQAAESGAFRGARRGVAGENIEDSTKNSIEEGLKREREEEERKRNGGGSQGEPTG